MKNCFSSLLAIVTAAALFPAARASIKAPYSPDADTVVLLHLDEPASGGIASNAVAGGAAFIATTNPSASTTRNPTPGILGAPGASGPGFNFGTAASLSSSNSMGLFIDADGNGIANLDAGALGVDAIQFSSFAGPSGEFTLEALVNLPAITGSNREIIAMDSSPSPRPFQFRITSGGLLEFNNIGTAGGDLTFAIPTTGPEGFVANQWFHVAATYDGVSTLNFYWTKVDPARTAATLLNSFTTAPTFNETGSAVLTIGNENRSTSGEGLLGRVDEVRISKVVRSAKDMIFGSDVQAIAPSIDPQPADQFLGVGETLLIQAHASGTPPLAYRWQKGTNGLFSDLSGQPSDSLSLPVAFATAGDYRFIAANSLGSATSAVAHVTVGASFNRLYPTGFDDHGAQLAGGEIDPHYTLWASANPQYLGPASYVLDSVSDYNANDASSKWIGPAPTLGGARGLYIYRTKFFIDSANSAASALSASVLSSGPLSVLLNGNSTGISNSAPAFPGPHRILFSFTITNGFVAGLNTLDFVVDNSNGALNAQPGNAFRVTSIKGLGIPSPAAAPQILANPSSRIVREGGAATFSVAATGGAPLSYQWYSNDQAIAGETNASFRLQNASAAGPNRIKVTVSNSLGSVTSSNATLTVLPSNSPILTTNVTVFFTPGAALDIPISSILQGLPAPEADSLALVTADTTGTNASNAASISLNGTTITYTNTASFSGPDRFTVTVTDNLGGDAVIGVNVIAGTVRLTASKGTAGRIRISWPSSAASAGAALFSGSRIDAPLATRVTDSVSTAGNESFVEITPGSGAQFFVLRKP